MAVDKAYSEFAEASLNLTVAEAMTAFLEDLASAHSPATVRTYQVALSRFSLFLKEHQGIDPLLSPVAKLEPDYAVSCIRWISNGQPNPASAVTKSANKIEPGRIVRVPKTTLATYVAGISRFYKWCALERKLVLPTDEYERMTLRFKELRGKVQRTILDKVPADETLDALLVCAAAARTSNFDAEAQPANPGFKGNLTKLAELDQIRYELIRLRNIALLQTLKSSGARVSELTTLTRGDLDNTNRRARVVGKGSKERWIYFSEVAWNTLQEYLTGRNRLMASRAQTVPAANTTTEAKTRTTPASKQAGRVKAKASEISLQPVFAAHHRGSGFKVVKPMTTDAVRKMLWGLVEQAELEVYITPHKFRHWFATRVLAATGDLAVTQDLLGHANPATTRIYAQVSETNKQKAHHQVFDT